MVILHTVSGTPYPVPGSPPFAP